MAEPLSIFVDTYGTGTKSDQQLVEIIRKNFDLRPGVIGVFSSEKILGYRDLLKVLSL